MRTSPFMFTHPWGTGTPMQHRFNDISNPNFLKWLWFQLFFIITSFLLCWTAYGGLRSTVLPICWLFSNVHWSLTAYTCLSPPGTHHCEHNFRLWWENTWKCQIYNYFLKHKLYTGVKSILSGNCFKLFYFRTNISW